MEDAHDEIRRVISKDLVAWSRRGDDERLSRVMSAVADIMLEVGAGRMTEARTLMGELLAWRDTFYDAELAEARAIKADRTANWTEIRDAARSAFKLDGNQLGAMDGILSPRPRRRDGRGVARTLTAASDSKRCCGARRRRRSWRRYGRSPTLRLLLSVEKEGQC